MVVEVFFEAALFLLALSVDELHADIAMHVKMLIARIFVEFIWVPLLEMLLSPKLSQDY